MMAENFFMTKISQSKCTACVYKTVHYRESDMLWYTVILQFFISEIFLFCFVRKLYLHKCFTLTKINYAKILSEKLILPCKRNEIGKIRNLKLYKSQTKNCTTQTGRIFCTYVLFTVRYFIVSLEFHMFTFTLILFS